MLVFLGGEHRGSDFVHVTLSTAGVHPCSRANTADLFYAPLGADVLHADAEDDAIDKTERVLQHEALHLAVVPATPMGAGQERPPDLDLALFFVIAVEPRRSDNPLRRKISGDQGSAGRHGLLKKRAEDFFFVAIPDRMLLPHERVGSHLIEIIEVLGAKRPEFDEFAFQNWLMIERPWVINPASLTEGPLSRLTAHAQPRS
jgi:hypothetical protein